MVDTAQQPAGDRGSGAEDDHEEDSRLVEAEQEDRQRKPGDRRHRLQAENRRPDRLTQHEHARDQDSDQASDRDRDRVAEQGPTQGDRDPQVEVGRAQVLREPLENRARAGQSVVRLPPSPYHDLPKTDRECDCDCEQSESSHAHLCGVCVTVK